MSAIRRKGSLRTGTPSPTPHRVSFSTDDDFRPLSPNSPRRPITKKWHQSALEPEYITLLIGALGIIVVSTLLLPYLIHLGLEQFGSVKSTNRISWPLPRFGGSGKQAAQVYITSEEPYTQHLPEVIDTMVSLSESSIPLYYPAKLIQLTAYHLNYAPDTIATLNVTNKDNVINQYKLLQDHLDMFSEYFNMYQYDINNWLGVAGENFKRTLDKINKDLASNEKDSEEELLKFRSKELQIQISGVADVLERQLQALYYHAVMADESLRRAGSQYLVIADFISKDNDTKNTHLKTIESYHQIRNASLSLSSKLEDATFTIASLDRTIHVIVRRLSSFNVECLTAFTTLLKEEAATLEGIIETIDEGVKERKKGAKDVEKALKKIDKRIQKEFTQRKKSSGRFGEREIFLAAIKRGVSGMEEWLEEFIGVE